MFILMTDMFMLISHVLMLISHVRLFTNANEISLVRVMELARAFSNYQTIKESVVYGIV